MLFAEGKVTNPKQSCMLAARFWYGKDIDKKVFHPSVNNWQCCVEHNYVVELANPNIFYSPNSFSLDLQKTIGVDYETCAPFDCSRSTVHQTCFWKIDRKVENGVNLLVETKQQTPKTWKFNSVFLLSNVDLTEQFEGGEALACRHPAKTRDSLPTPQGFWQRVAHWWFASSNYTLTRPFTAVPPSAPCCPLLFLPPFNCTDPTPPSLCRTQIECCKHSCCNITPWSRSLLQANFLPSLLS